MVVSGCCYYQLVLLVYIYSWARSKWSMDPLMIDNWYFHLSCAAAGRNRECPGCRHHEWILWDQIFLQLCRGELACHQQKWYWLPDIDWWNRVAKMLSIWCVVAGVACCRGEAAETEHRRPHRRPQFGESASRRWVCLEIPGAGHQCLRPLQSWTLTQCHAGCCLPNPGQSFIIAQHLLNLAKSMKTAFKNSN